MCQRRGLDQTAFLSTAARGLAQRTVADALLLTVEVKVQQAILQDPGDRRLDLALLQTRCLAWGQEAPRYHASVSSSVGLSTAVLKNAGAVGQNVLIC